ncbi:hypothetical protein ASPSYDRAFT_36271 [Aspergillus sydowii CBS 593.65]|uniref:Uncharacterized protein n=1 Tax=Aspergillus sydowii CBS 593.65 TaxID=1036612 RepID=A0A1L9T1N1_9EURO|nr:uncharacterized protein ASPSYDRAFT_36271 [Aspergillus sydowii CBS 593.65]OJJ53327.1 hypothetical protein ASPSYDRAFT_36271 [Aspergillus sydowii CBS 593.65]
MWGRHLGQNVLQAHVKGLKWALDTDWHYAEDGDKKEISSIWRMNFPLWQVAGEDPNFWSLDRSRAPGKKWSNNGRSKSLIIEISEVQMRLCSWSSMPPNQSTPLWVPTIGILNAVKPKEEEKSPTKKSSDRLREFIRRRNTGKTSSSQPAAEPPRCCQPIGAGAGVPTLPAGPD